MRLDWPRAQLRVGADGTYRQLELRRVQLDGFGGRVAGDGRLTLRDAIAGRLQLKGQGLIPDSSIRAWPEKLILRLTWTSIAPGILVCVFRTPSGTLFKRPLRVSGAVARADGVLAFDDARPLVRGDEGTLHAREQAGSVR